MHKVKKARKNNKHGGENYFFVIMLVVVLLTGKGVIESNPIETTHHIGSEVTLPHTYHNNLHNSISNNNQVVSNNERVCIQEEVEEVKEVEKTESILEYVDEVITSSVEQIKEETSTLTNQYTSKVVVALTFDDGPGPYTSELIDILDEYGAHATFFVLGEKVKKYSDAVEKAANSNNEIAVHGYDHTSFKKISVEEVVAQINRTKELIEDLDIVPSSLVRPPYGSINGEIKENVSVPFILWSVDTRDWESRDPEAIIQEVYNGIEPGSILLFHDIHATTVEFFREYLEELSQNYYFTTVSDLFDYYNQDLEPNNSYRKAKTK